MRIVTLTCPNCGTLVAANELEKRRVMACPRLECDELLRFEDLPVNDREFIVENRDRFRME